jgi:hypothetical protein
LDKKVAMGFQEGALFVIEVNDEERDSAIDYGYAFVKDVTVYK